MSKGKDEALERMDEDYRVDSPDYGQSIIEMVGKIKNPGTLEYLHTFIKLFIEKWG